MHDQIKQLYTNIAKLQSNYNLTGSEGSRINFLLQEIRELELEVFSNRHKRGLINGLGSIIKALTGNLDNEDLNNIENQLRKNRIDLQNKLSVTSNILDKFHQKLINLTQQQTEYFAKLHHSEYLLERDIMLIDIIFFADTIRDLLMEVSEGLILAHNGIFHPHILPNKVFKDALSYIPASQRVHEDMITLASICKISTFRTEETLHYVITIPLVGQVIYEHVTLLPIITIQPDLSCLYPVKQMQAILKYETEVFTVETCHDGNPSVCQTRPFIADNCTKEILNNTPTISCRQVPIRCPKEYQRNVSPGTDYYFTSETITVKEDCLPPRRRQFQGSLIIQNTKCPVYVKQGLEFGVRNTYETLFLPKLQLREPERVPHLELSVNEDVLTQQIAALTQMQVEPTAIRNISYSTLVICVIITLSLVLIFLLYKNKLINQTYAPRNTEVRELQQPMFGLPASV